MFEMWIISMFDAINGFSIFFSIIGCIAAIVYLVCNGLRKTQKEDSELYKQNTYAMKRSKPFIFGGIVAMLLLITVPSTKTGYAIAGFGPIFENVVQDGSLGEVSDLAVKAMKKWLTTQINDENSCGRIDYDEKNDANNNDKNLEDNEDE